MRHRTHNHVLGVKTAHRRSLIGNLASALFTNARITTTLSRAKALRPFAEHLITYAKKAEQSADKSVKLHYYRLALAKLRNEDAAQLLFKERVQQFLGQYITDWNAVLAALSTAIIPVLVVFLLGQRHFMRGMEGAVK